ncbi:MAG TPA: LLM class flavin-dependent oxidoreductase [Methylomirabilota bacterium]|jgi:alkanesulfonate monooxygenase SsuD/methylene tetrahydromethanopterin reductase-like flavin-dependent oxidoreductase (luciferase family)|nr:LLM class flavin-dependent oxidoreductase [Methylomirabilota bacterium]
MDFGIFLEQMRRGVSQTEAFDEMFALIDAAESWGLDIVWLAEMMVNPARSVLSAPLLMSSWAVSRTERLRVGTAVQLLPLNHPLRVAGEVATLDHISHGRFDFGIGRSGSPRSYDALGVPYEESQDRFFEALEIILTAWKGEPFSHHGRFYQFDDVTVAPRPYRAPHPLVRMAATTPDTFPRVGRMGLPIFVGLRGMDIPELSQCLRVYRQAWRDAGHPGDGDACLRIPLYAAPTEQAAREEPYDTITYYMERQANLTLQPLGRAGTGPVDFREGQARRLTSLSYDDILARKVAFGTGPSLVDRLGEIREQLGITGIAAELNPGGLLPLAREMRSLEILTQQVMPALK